MTVDRLNRRDIPLVAEVVDPVAGFDKVHRAYQQAVEATSEEPVRSYRIAGRTIQLRFAGRALVPSITPALAHLAAKDGQIPALTICLWDSASTGTVCPPLPWNEHWEGYTLKGERVSLLSPRGDYWGFYNDRVLAHIGAELFSLLDLEQNLAIYWCQDADQLPLYEKGAPVRTILHWWLHHHGYQIIHAGAVGRSDGGVLLAGKGGAGKSITALTCLSSGILYASDDYSLLQVDPVPYIYSLYNTAKVRAADIGLVPHLRHAISNVHRLEMEKAVFFMHLHYPQRIVAGFPIKALLLPRVTGRPGTTITSASPADSLKALALSTLRQLAGAGRSSLRIIGQLVKQVPTYHLELGTDLNQIPQVILDIIDGHSNE